MKALYVLAAFAFAVSGCASMSDSEKLEKAWACNPTTSYRKPLYFGDAGGEKIVFSHADCQPPRMSLGEQNSLLNILKRHLGEGFLGQFSSERNPDSLEVVQAFRSEKQRRDYIALEQTYRIQAAEEKKRLDQLAEYQKSPEFQQKLREQQAEEQKRIERLAREAEEQKRLAAIAKAKGERERIALEDRKRKLRSGQVKAANFAEAELAHAPQSLHQVMVSPLLVPDKAYYSGVVQIEGLQRPGLIRGISPFLPSRVAIVYVFLRTGNKTTNYAPGPMRIGATIRVLGRYVDNVKYNTVRGEPRTAPLIEVMYIGDFSN